MRITDDYFEWLCDIVCGRRLSKKETFRNLLEQLHSTEFTYTILKDSNRAEDGIDLRRRFDRNFYMDEPCSVLEMMVALSIRCEETIMDNPEIGDRTGQWFWNMVVNLGLGPMTNKNYDADFVYDILQRFLDREYEPDGEGGLFTVRGCDRDLRKMEIWVQMCWYLDTIV